MERPVRRKYASGWDVFDVSALFNPPTWLSSIVYIIGFIFIILILFLLSVSITRLALGSLDYSNSGSAEHARNLLVALGAIVAAPFIVWRTWIGHQQWRTSVEQISVQVETLNTGLMSKSIELLGAMREESSVIRMPSGEYETKTVQNSNREARIGAIVILRRIALNSIEFRRMIVDIFVEYIKSNTRELYREISDAIEREDDGYEVFEPDRFGAISADVEFCFKSLLDISERYGSWDLIELSGAALVGVELSYRNISNIDFGKSYLVDMNFLGSDFNSCHIDGDRVFDCLFSGANLHNIAFLSKKDKRFYSFDEKTILPDGYKVFVEPARSWDGFEFPERKYFARASSGE